LSFSALPATMIPLAYYPQRKFLAAQSRRALPGCSASGNPARFVIWAEVWAYQSQKFRDYI
jgi:hypothetical protein